MLSLETVASAQAEGARLMPAEGLARVGRPSRELCNWDPRLASKRSGKFYLDFIGSELDTGDNRPPV
jgi:hypothetical protein